MAGPPVVLLGMLTKIPVAGPAWLVLHYMEGLRRLGFDPWYVEAHARTPSMFMEHEDDDASDKAAGFVARIMSRYGFGDRWAFHALHEDGRVYGLSETRLKRLYSSAELIVNLHGGTAPLPEHAETGRLVYLETDPVELEVELYDGRREAIDSLEQHVAFFTWGLNYGQPDCAVPLHDRLSAVPSPPPVLLDAWAAGPARPSAPFTTVANWEQPLASARDRRRHVPLEQALRVLEGRRPSEPGRGVARACTFELQRRRPWAPRPQWVACARRAPALRGARRLQGLHPVVARRVQRRQGPERPPSQRVVQRAQRHIPRGGPPSRPPGHRVRIVPSGRRGSFLLRQRRRSRCRDRDDSFGPRPACSRCPGDSTRVPRGRRRPARPAPAR